MCPEKPNKHASSFEIPRHPDQIDPPLGPSDNGSTDSPGPTGPPSLSAQLSEMTVRLHQGLSHLSVASLNVTEDVPGTFTALKRADLGGFTVMLSCALTSSQYAALIARLEGGPTALGENVSVELAFEPLTPNLVQPTTAPSI